jgi:hypothetical protein
MSRYKLIFALLAGALSASLVLSAAAQAPWGSGAQLMTPEERAQHRQQMMNMTPEQRQVYRQEVHKQMQERAKEKGITLPATPSAGRGIGGPGWGRGWGYPGYGMGYGPGYWRYYGYPGYGAAGPGAGMTGAGTGSAAAVTSPSATGPATPEAPSTSTATQ